MGSFLKRDKIYNYIVWDTFASKLRNWFKHKAKVNFKKIYKYSLFLKTFFKANPLSS